MNVQDRNETPFRMQDKLKISSKKRSSLGIFNKENETVKNMNLNAHCCFGKENEFRQFENEKKNVSNINLLNNEMLKLGIIFKDSATTFLLANSYLLFLLFIFWFVFLF